MVPQGWMADSDRVVRLDDGEEPLLRVLNLHFVGTEFAQLTHPSDRDGEGCAVNSECPFVPKRQRCFRQSSLDEGGVQPGLLVEVALQHVPCGIRSRAPAKAVARLQRRGGDTRCGSGTITHAGPVVLERERARPQQIGQVGDRVRRASLEVEDLPLLMLTDVIALPPLPSHLVEPFVHVPQISVRHLE